MKKKKKTVKGKDSKTNKKVNITKKKNTKVGASKNKKSVVSKSKKSVVSKTKSSTESKTKKIEPKKTVKRIVKVINSEDLPKKKIESNKPSKPITTAKINDVKNKKSSKKVKGKVVSKDQVTNLKHLKKEKEEDLIITREIDLKDLDSYIETENEEAEYLADTAILNVQEIRKALEESEKAEEEKAEKDEKINIDEDYTFLLELNSSKKGKNRFSRIWLIILLIVVILMLFLSFINAFVSKDGRVVSPTNVIRNLKKEQQNEKKKKEEEEKKQKLYDNCLNESANDLDNSEEINNYIDELNDYLKKYKVSVSYKDIKNGFSFNYSEGKSYYAASSIKSLDGLYAYDKASLGEISLDDTVTYTSDFKWTSSKYMQTHKFGDKISVRDLVKNAIMVSDNSAHQMLVSYLGRKNLKDYGNSLGAKYTLEGGDNFGHISASDGVLYMENIYYFIVNNEELGNELKSYFVDSEQNDLKMEGIEAACKYGEYSSFYHNVGIVFDSNPYVIVVLTSEGKSKGQELIREISSKIYNLHKTYYSNRESVCKNKIYGK